jgi:hypothetical protein
MERHPTYKGDESFIPVCTLPEAEPELHVCCAPPLVMSVPAGRFVSGITMKPHNWVSYTVIHGSVLGFQAVHLQIQLALGIVSGAGESALHGVWVVYTTTIFTNMSNTLQPLPWSLGDTVHIVITKGESGGCTGEFQGSPRWY